MRRALQLLTAALALGLVSSAGATTPGTNGRIAYASARNGNNLEIYSANADGSAERRLTWTNDTEQSPAWSPDGTQIAYSRAPEGGGRWRIWVMNADGSDQKQLTATPDYDSSDEIQPRWSPDGTRIAFASTRIDTYNIWIINADGTGLRRLTTFFSDAPDWSPDGRRLVYVGSDAIGVVNADGTDPHPITGPGGWAGAPSWSPDGNRIAFYRNDDRRYPGELYTISPDGSNETPLTTGGFNNGSPVWSPDGTKIMFTRSQQAPDPWHLWVMNSDGSNAQQLNAAENLGPDWGTSQIIPEVSPPDAPTIQVLSPEEGRFYFPSSPPQAFYQCSSFVSWIVSCEGDVPLFAPVDVSTAGMHSFTVRAVDADGRTATKTITYEVVDVLPPQIDLRTPADGATYDLGANVTVDYSCGDPDGGDILYCGGDLPDGAPLDTSQAGTFRFSATAVDNARHITQTQVTYTIVDRRPPLVHIAYPNDNGFYFLGSTVAADYDCSGVSGAQITSCSGPVPSGSPFDTSALGPHTFAVTATDANGNTTTRKYTYTVIYDFKGFDSPLVANQPFDAKAGDAIPLKFSLAGNQGLNVITKTMWYPVACADFSPAGAGTTGQGKLSYNASTGRYTDLVATDRAWRASCYLLRIDLADGWTYGATYVRFK